MVVGGETDPLGTEAPRAAAAPWRVDRGTCFAIFMFDVGLGIDLPACEKLIKLGTHRAFIRPQRKAPHYFEFQPPPLRVTREIESIAVGRFSTEDRVDLVLYDFGAVSITYRIALHDVALDGMSHLSSDLYDHKGLLADARLQVGHLIEVIAAAIPKVRIQDTVEDYVIFQIAEVVREPGADATIAPWEGNRQGLAQVLRAEPESLSHQEVSDALSQTIAYGANDMTVVDWNAAVVFAAQADDVRAVLEFANVELLEMRTLDQSLDDSLDQSYDALVAKPSRWGRRTTVLDMRRIARLQVDGAMLFEGVNNSLKLVGDQYLARLYRTASKRFHLEEWDASILRKLSALDSIYAKISDRANTNRMETLEWIIILLITVSIALPFVLPLGAKP